jgi:cell division protein ZapE
MRSEEYLGTPHGRAPSESSAGLAET